MNLFKEFINRSVFINPLRWVALIFLAALVVWVSFRVGSYDPAPLKYRYMPISMATPDDILRASTAARYEDFIHNEERVRISGGKQ